MPLFELRDVSYRYNTRQERPSLKEVSATIAGGRRTVILGANGAGKSTLFYHLNGIFKPEKGEVYYNDSLIEYSREALRSLRSDVCVVVQNPDEQIFSSTVEEDVAFGPLNMGLPRDEVEQRVVDSLVKVGMEAYRLRPSTQLSYGQRKRVSLAGALAVDPKVLILDEPTAGLDPQMAQEVMELIDHLCCAGTSVIVSTHDVDLAYAWADDVHVLRHGRMVYSGVSEGFFEDPVQTAFAGLCRPHSFSINSYITRIRGDPETPYPRSNSQLLARLTAGTVDPGTVRIVPVNLGMPSVDCTDVSVGAYGAAAKKAVKEAGVFVDYAFDALEMCMIDAVKGKDSILFCDASMTQIAADRIRSLERFGVRPGVVL